MKNLILAIFVIFTCISCDNSNQPSIVNKEECQINDYTLPFKLICSGYYYDLVYDTETNIEYVVSTGAYNKGNFVMLYDSTGNPKKYNK